MKKFFVILIHKLIDDSYVNNIFTDDTKDAAYHRYFEFMSTYGYGLDENVNYCACYIIDSDGILYENKVDDRTVSKEEEEE